MRGRVLVSENHRVSAHLLAAYKKYAPPHNKIALKASCCLCFISASVDMAIKSAILLPS
jgi:hypothetical protein